MRSVLHRLNWPVAGILDRNSGLISGQEPGLPPAPLLGSDESLSDFDPENFELLITVGAVRSSRLRRRIFDNSISLGYRFATIFSQTSVIGCLPEDCGPGTVVLERAMVNATARVGKNCIINTSALIEHDCVVGDHVHIATGAVVNGGVRIGDDVVIGSGAIIREGLSIHSGVTIGAGAVLLKDAPEGATLVGCPARPMAGK